MGFTGVKVQGQLLNRNYRHHTGTPGLQSRWPRATTMHLNAGTRLRDLELVHPGFSIRFLH